MTIEEFKKTNDFRDISYMIKHVPFVNARCSCIKDLGYKTSVEIITKTTKSIKGNVYYDKKGNIRMQITDKIKDKNYFWCVII